MTDETQNNSITGSWYGGSYGWGPFSGDVTFFDGEVTETGEEFSAIYRGGSLGVSAVPGSVSGGQFTFNGPLDSLLGWSAGAAPVRGPRGGDTQCV